MLNTPFSPWPSFTQKEADKIHSILLSNRVNSKTGTECQLFEQEFSQFSDTKYAIAVSNGTTAIDLALRAIEISPGDEVIVPARTFFATASSVALLGGIPIFADVDRQSGNICPESVRTKITNKTKAIMCVHLAGWPCDMDALLAIANEFGLKIIEDCAQAHGAKYNGKSVGSFGDIGCWSFCQDKIMTTGGEGGLVSTNNYDLWYKMWSFKDHGKDYNTVNNQQKTSGFKWLHHSFGSNYRMTELQAAIGRIQLTYMADWIRLRNRNASLLARAFESFDVASTFEVPSGITHGQYKFYAYVNLDKLAENWTRDRIIEIINSLGVPCYQGACPEVYLEKAFDDLSYRPTTRLPIAKQLGETSIVFLVHPTLTDTEIDKTVEVIKEVLLQAQQG